MQLIGSSNSDQSLDEILTGLVEADRELRNAFQELSQKKAVLDQIQAVQDEISKKDAIIATLETSLISTVSSLEECVFKGRQALETYEASRKAPVSVEELVTSARNIACSYGACAPPGWTMESPLRPYPTELQMGHSQLALQGASSAVLPESMSL